jgi:hypothetical protein
MLLRRTGLQHPRASPRSSRAPRVSFGVGPANKFYFSPSATRPMSTQASKLPRSTVQLLQQGLVAGETQTPSAAAAAAGAGLRLLQWNILADGLAQFGDFLNVGAPTTSPHTLCVAPACHRIHPIAPTPSTG